MEEKQNTIDRRNFLKTVGATGLASFLASANANARPGQSDAAEKEQKAKPPQVPVRKLGKTGVKVPHLSLGTLRVDTENQILLRRTLQLGINYWDTAYNYSGGNSELGIGKFLSKNPDLRKKLFLVTKASGARTVPDIEKRLQTSLERMNTNYIDLYYGVHGLSDPAQLTDELKQWAEGAKKRKLIRYFGFSTHSNQAKCLAAAAKLDWIDAIMTRYSFRDLQNAEMQAAIDACYKAKIGLVAMKTIGRASRRRGSRPTEAEAEKKLIEHLLQRGFTREQAAIKLVLEDKRISSACVGMLTIPILNANVAAALDKTKLTRADKEALREYAAATCSGYCAGCAEICDAALPDLPYTSDIMRYLMYYNSYSDTGRARELFAQIPADVRSRLLTTDYSIAEARCPQRMPIAKLIAEAVGKLA
jgi:predicted aldo/keto reductase-like oxidoreductase